MNIHNLYINIKDKLDFVKKHTFGNQLMRKKTISTIEKVLSYGIIGFVSFILAIFFVIIPRISDMQIMQESIAKNVLQIYGDDQDNEGLKFVNKRIQNELNKQKKVFEEKEKLTLEKYDQALPKDLNIYNIAVFLEDYTVTLSTDEKPIILSNISFGKESLKVVDLKSLQQENQDKRIIIPAEYRVIPVTLSLEAHREKFEQFLSFVYHSGDTQQFYFKGQPVPVMSVESLNLPISEVKERKKAQLNTENTDQIESYSLKMNLYFQKKEILKSKKS
jgi:hypothetical protein